LIVLVGLVLLLRAGFQAAPHQPVSDGDSRIVAYQGEDVLGGGQPRLEQVLGHGKPVVLNFFAGQCPSCRAEMPEFQRVADSYSGKVVFAGVDVGPFTGLGSHEDARRLLRDLHITYAAGYAVSDAPLRQYQVEAMPTTLIFDAGGSQVFHRSGVVTEAELRGQLQRLA
jgi:thiol-disulfide isomerase/thioredoxin